METPFRFYTQSSLPFLLGRRAHDPEELLAGIREAPLSSIYYHTHHFLLEHHYMVSGPLNDFAYWITNILGMARLGERLGSIDIISFNSLEALRTEFVNHLSDEISKTRRLVHCQDGEEFNFVSSKSVAAPTPYIAHNLGEMIEILGQVTINSIYYHFFEAPLRLGQSKNDFTTWLNSLGETQAAQKIAEIDPYTMTLEELRTRIIRIGRERYARR